MVWWPFIKRTKCYALWFYSFGCTVYDCEMNDSWVSLMTHHFKYLSNERLGIGLYNFHINAKNALVRASARMKVNRNTGHSVGYYISVLIESTKWFVKSLNSPKDSNFSEFHLVWKLNHQLQTEQHMRTENNKSKIIKLNLSAESMLCELWRRR